MCFPHLFYMSCVGVMWLVYINMHIGKWSVVQVIIYDNCMFMDMDRYQYELVPFIPYKYSKHSLYRRINKYIYVRVTFIFDTHNMYIKYIKLWRFIILKASVFIRRWSSWELFFNMHNILGAVLSLHVL